jgi:hypothetical protein
MKPIDDAVSRQRFYQLKHKALGLCQLCPMPAVTSTHCQRHAQMVSDRQSTRMATIRRANGIKQRLCSACGERGHYAKCCRRRAR